MKRNLETREGNTMVSPKLKLFLSTKLSSSLENLFIRLNLPNQFQSLFTSSNPSSSNPLSSFSSDIINNIELNLLNKGEKNISVINKELNTKGKLLQNAINVMSTNEVKNFFGLEPSESTQLTSPLSPSSDLAENILTWYDNYLKSNQEIYTNIQKQHQEVIENSWNKILEKKEGLLSYQIAAEAMGSKKWVKESNHFMLDFLVNFYCQGGAARFYFKYNRENNIEIKEKTRLPSLIRKPPTNLKLEESSTTSSTSSSSPLLRPIKILDVGSCYNPIAKFEESEGIEVTALDLSPACSSVIPCDFLGLKVENEDSFSLNENIVEIDENINENNKDNIIYEDSNLINNNNENFLELMKINNKSKIPMKFNMKTKKLTKILSSSYDVIIMSLVLCYLPSSIEREIMIKNAKNLLIKYDEKKKLELKQNGYEFYLHDRSLLLISEKQSILLPNNYKNNEINDDEYNNDSNNKLKKKLNHNKQYKIPFHQLPSINDWKLSFLNLGFDLISYRLLPSSDGKFSHIFLLALSNNDIPSIPYKNKYGKIPDFSIKQDYASDR